MSGSWGLDRRRFLGLVGVAGAAVAVGGGLAGCGKESAGVTLPSAAPLPPQYKVPLPIPRVARPVSTDGGVDRYEVTEKIGDAEIVPGTTTKVWGYDGTFPGPTFEARAGREIAVTVRNELPQPTSTHLHGGVTPPGSDGYPTDLVVPVGGTFDPTMHHSSGMKMTVRPDDWTLHKGQKTYRYPLAQRAATLWYHDHRMDFSAPQVWRGLAGVFVVRDDEDDALPLPKGDKDIPLLICDRSFAADGSFAYPAKDPSLTMTPGVTEKYMQGVQGDVVLVNGAPWPELEVTATRYRFRIVNGSNARRYQLGLTGGARFVQVGSDQGLLAAPVRHDSMLVSPGERFDVVIDFAGFKPGTTVTLTNALGAGRTGTVMRFRVSRTASDDSRIPARLSDYRPLRRSQSRATRQFDFRLTSGGWSVNKQFFSPTTMLARPHLDTVETWRFSSDFHHPVHAHLAHFQVVARDGKDPAPTDAGWKDTVDVRPYEVVEVLVRFSGFRGRYMLHCHNLEHEDMAMMAGFETI
ncbi:MAG TPA: multicopper oxidase domain-containing protein [Actinocatenispora sp.]